jgi:hypothetical protein
VVRPRRMGTDSSPPPGGRAPETSPWRRPGPPG